MLATFVEDIFLFYLFGVWWDLDNSYCVGVDFREGYSVQGALRSQVVRRSDECVVLRCIVVEFITFSVAILAHTMLGSI